MSIKNVLYHIWPSLPKNSKMCSLELVKVGSKNFLNSIHYLVRMVA